jgi:hypothetical protein
MRFVHSSTALPYLLQRSERPIHRLPSLGVSSLDLGPHGTPLRLFFRLRDKHQPQAPRPPVKSASSLPKGVPRSAARPRVRVGARAKASLEPLAASPTNRGPCARSGWPPSTESRRQVMHNPPPNRLKLRRKCHVPKHCARIRNGFPPAPLSGRGPRPTSVGALTRGVSSLDLGRRRLPSGPFSEPP